MLRSRTAGVAALAVASALSLVAAPAPSAAAVPPAAVRYAPGSPGMLVAQDIARRTWGMDPCGGQLDIAWVADDAAINARALWANPQSSYGAPELNEQCRIVFNTAASFGWARLCTVLVHEYGHLTGHPHTADGPDVMSPVYRAPLPACAATPDPAAPRPVAATSATRRAPQSRSNRSRSDRRPRAGAGIRKLSASRAPRSSTTSTPSSAR